MFRYIKTVVLAAFAALALSAAFASGASAQDGVLTAGDTDPLTHTATDIYATQEGAVTNNVFEAFDQQLHCTNGSNTFLGEASGTDTHVKIKPDYNDCFVPNEVDKISLTATVTENGCYYTFNQPTHKENHTTWTGTVDLVCPDEEKEFITVHVYLRGGSETQHNVHGLKLCTETIPAQAGINGVEYHNVAGSPDKVTVTINSTNIEASKTGLCGEGTAKKEAKYTSELTLTSSEGHDLWVSTHQ